MELMLTPDVDLSAEIKKAFDGIASELDTWGDSGATGCDVEPIPHEQYPGFIPTTNGGWKGIARFRFNEGKEAFSCLEDDAASDTKMMKLEFRHEIKSRLEKANFLDEATFDSLTDDQIWSAYAEEAEEYAEEWEEADSDIFFLMFRAIYFNASNARNETGEDEVYFYAGVNNDYNYGRDKISWLPGSCWAAEWEQTVKLADLTPEKIAEMKAAIIDFFRKA